MQNKRVAMQRIVTARATIAELDTNAADCEQREQSKQLKLATKLKEEALL